MAQKVLSKGDLGSALSIHWSWGIGVMLGIYVAGGVSGAHLNPAVTLAQACLGRLPWRKVPLYMLSQYAGAFVAGACVYLVYYGKERRCPAYNSITHFHWMMVLFWPIRFVVTIVSIGNN